MTECGYHNRVDNPNHPGVTEAAEARFLPCLLFVYFPRGMTKAYKYEFLDLKPNPEFTDMEKHFGLVRVDGTPKPSFQSLANLIHLFSDPGPAFTPGSLPHQLTGATENLQHLLLQARHGRFWLVLFQEAVSYDPKAHRDLEVTPAGNCPFSLRAKWPEDEHILMNLARRYMLS